MRISKRKTILLNAMLLLGVSSGFVVQANELTTGVTPRVVNGEFVRDGEWLSQVSLAGVWNANKPFCGGTLIAPNWVLTAAHCVEDMAPEKLAITIGLYNYQGYYDLRDGTYSNMYSGPVPNGKNAREYFVAEEIIIHEDYGKSYFDDDVALVKFNGNSSVTPAYVYGGPAKPSLPSKSDTEQPLMSEPDLIGQLVTAVGFGSIVQQEADQPNRPFYPGTKRATDMTVLSHELCMQKYSEGESFSFVNPNKQICTSIPEGGLGSCQGDSGGPLYLRNASNKLVTAGVVSWGVGCAWPGYPGVYARTSHYIDFIKEHVPEVMVDTADYQHSVSRDMSGAWFDPKRNGEGFIVEMQPNNRFAITWFTYDFLGLPIYLIGTGTYDTGAEMVTATLYKTSGVKFGDKFSSSDVNLHTWGTLTFTPSGCQSAVATFQSNDVMYGNGVRNLVPLQPANTSNCSGLWDGSKRQMSGTWYSPMRDGEGVIVQTTGRKIEWNPGVIVDKNSVDVDNVIWEQVPGGWMYGVVRDAFSFYYFTYDKLGNQKTILGTGFMQDGNGYGWAYQVSGPTFKSNDADFARALRTEDWGGVEFSLDNCKALTMRFNASTSGYGIGERKLIRLSDLAGNLATDEAGVCDRYDPQYQ